MEESSPTVIVLAGCNGAGKTTASRTLLADTLGLLTFVNADVIASGLSGFAPESAAIEAGRIMLDRLHALATQRASFAFETTLASRSLAGWLTALRESGYLVRLFYFWVGEADLAVARVAQRVSQGGHGVPEPTIRRRYTRSLNNFLQLYCPVVNRWSVYTTTNVGLPTLIAEGTSTGSPTVYVAESWERMQQEASQ